MISKNLRVACRRLTLLAAFTLVACGGGSGESGFTSTGTTATPAPVEPVTPAPAPVTPTPTPTGTTVAAPTLAGLPAIASGIDVSKLLVPAWGTGGIPGPDTEGAFRFSCSPTHNSYDDPIVFPNQPGKSHLHTFFGNTKADANSTYQSLRTTGDSSCNNMLNRSAYWVPAMMNGRGKVVMPDFVSIYYKGDPKNSAYCTRTGKQCVPIPRGLRFVFGRNAPNPADNTPSYNRWWTCYTDIPGGGAAFDNIPKAAVLCPVGSRIGTMMTAPECWNGTDLDSPDHRSHLVYPRDDVGRGYNKCPDTHPYVIPHFTIGVWYTTDETLDRSGNVSPDANTWYLSSDRMPGMPNAIPGTTMHADWFGAWEDSIMDIWMANCIEKMLSCNGGDLGNGQQMQTLHGYDVPSHTVLVDIPIKPN
jgi:hypothetical protein